MATGFVPMSFQMNEDQADTNRINQQSNPNTQVAPTPEAPAMEKDTFTTTDPINGGVTPEKTADPIPVKDTSAINKQLTQGAGAGQGSGTSVARAYGFTNYGYDSGEDLNKLPEYLENPQGEMTKKVVANFNMKDGDAKYTQFAQDFNAVDKGKKQKGSAVGMDVNIGPSANETLNIGRALMMDSKLLNNSKLKATGEVQAFESAYNEMMNLLKNSTNDPDAIQAAMGKLKMAMLPVATKAQQIGYATNQSTSAMDVLKQFESDMQKFTTLYNSSGEDLVKSQAEIEKSMNRYTVQYKSLEDLPSLRAKKSLNDSSVYQEFLTDVYKNNPLLQSKIDRMKNSPIISDEEKNFIKDVFLGPNGYQNLIDARKQAIEQLGPIQGTAIFKPFQAILDVKDLPYQTQMDDAMADAKVSGNYATRGINFATQSGNSGVSYPSTYKPSGQYSSQTYTKGSLNSRVKI